MPQVSIIVPSYNSRLYIAETVHSLLNQTYQDFEIIVVDDGSTDNQKELLQPLLDRDDRIKYFYQTNAGVSAARNFGYSKSSGTYIAFVDADDTWLPDNLEKKVTLLKDKNADFVHSDAQLINSKSESLPGIYSGDNGLLLDKLLLWKGTQVPGPSSILVTRSLIEKTGLFDCHLSTSADKDFFIRAAVNYQIFRIPEVTWKYRLHETNMHKNMMVMENDVKYLYAKCKRLNLFRSSWFKRKCFSNMHIIMAASWAREGKNKKMAWQHLWRALLENPFSLFQLIKRTFAR